MEPTSTEQGEAPARSRKTLNTKLIPIGVILIVVGISIVLVSRPAPGQRTITDTSVRVIVNVSKGGEVAAYPVVVKEGSDPAHEADHIIEPLQGVDGVSSATVDWSSGAVVLTVEFDPAVVSASEVANVVAKSGYLAAPTK